MNYPHRIRLRGPWECQPLQSANTEQTLPQDREVAVPGSLRDQGLVGFKGAVLLRRRFGYPGQIDSWERVWITMDRIDGTADVRFNDEMLARQQTGRFTHDVTSLLQPHNRLEVFLKIDSDAGGLLGEVAMEVRARAYMENVSFRRQEDGSIRIAGSVAGDCADMLELYAILDRRNVHYETTRATKEGQAFAFTIAPEEAKGSQLRIELVNRSQIWYAVESILAS